MQMRLLAGGGAVLAVLSAAPAACAGAGAKAPAPGCSVVVRVKKAGAAAEAGMKLDDVERVAIKANKNTVSFGVAFSGCTLPGAKEPLFTVPAQRIGVGLGIHGEPGISEEDMMPASALAKMLVDKLVCGVRLVAGRQLPGSAGSLSSKMRLPRCSFTALSWA